jgi:DNA-binding HxlR family transcriptional regulator
MTRAPGGWTALVGRRDGVGQVGQDLLARDLDPGWLKDKSSVSHERNLSGSVASRNRVCEDHSVLRNDYEGQICSVAKTMELIGERWSVLIIRDVFQGRRRFSDMQRGMGIARNVLASRLQRLVDAGILERRLYSERPERYEYFLTEKGLDLWPAMVALMHWGDKHLPQPDGPPMRIVHKGDCGGEIDDRRICTRCGKHLGVREARGVLDGSVLEQLEAAGVS